MAWGDNVADWKPVLDELGMTEFFRDTAIPDLLEKLLENANWEVILHAYSQKEFSAENVEFLRAVGTFETSGDLNQAAEIYRHYVSAAAPQQVNLSSAVRKDLDDIFGPEGEGIGPPSVLDAARNEITALLRRDTFVRFKAAAGPAQKALMKEYVDANAVTDTETDWDNIEGRGRGSDSADAGGMTIDEIDTDAVAAVNAEAMKNLAVEAGVAFVQAGAHVLLGQSHQAPYYTVLRNEPNYCTGTLTMVAKGGAFNPGKVKVEGSNDPQNFEAAIRASSKKKVDFTFA